jgi:hypothetical protein
VAKFKLTIRAALDTFFGKKSSSLTVSQPIGFNRSNGMRASLPAHSGGLVASIITLPFF